MSDFKPGDKVALKDQPRQHMRVVEVSPDLKKVQATWPGKNGRPLEDWFYAVSLMQVAEDDDDEPPGVWFVSPSWEPKGWM